MGEADRAAPDVLSVRQLLRGSVLGPHGRSLGHIRDLAIRRTRQHYPAVVGVLVCLGGYDTYVPAAKVIAWRRDAICLSDLPALRLPATLSRCTVLTTELLGIRFTATGRGDGLRARDFQLHRVLGRWAITAINTRRGPASALSHHRRTVIDWAESSLACSPSG